MGPERSRLLASRKALLFAGAALGLTLVEQAGAVEFQLGGYDINLDTTLSSSVGFRTSDPDYDLIGIANGGRFGVANEDNGDVNYRPGNVVEATQSITTELQIKKDDYGIFVRANGYYDPSVMIDMNSRPFPFNDAQARDIGANLRLLDAYLFASPEIFGHIFDLRVGNQALNWGESTFFQFGINSITPLDLTQLRTPGAELRTAFLPIPAVDVKATLVDDLSIEGFWQPYWTRTHLEPASSFFSTNDVLSDGGTFLNQFSFYPDAFSSRQLVNLLPDGNPFGAAIGRSLDRHPTGVDEFGFALRKSFPALNDLEVGLYFENYDSRTPFLSFRTGSSHIGNLPGPLSVLSADTVSELFRLLAPPAVYEASTYAATSSYFADYPKNIKLVGFSWNLTGPAGIAIQGEISHRFDQPVQLAAADLSLAVDAPAICHLSQSALFAAILAPSCAQARADPAIQATGGVAGFNQDIQGWVRRDVTQIQSTATKLLDPIPSMGINSIALVGEIGFDYVHDFGHLAGLYNAPYSTDSNSAFVQAGTVDARPVPGTDYTVGHLSSKGLATQFSGAYNIVVVFDMPAVLPFGVGMKPTLSLQHDFIGTSPAGVNVFVANTAAASVGVSFSYLQAWSLGLQYTNHFPVFAGGKFYGALDRDFASATLSYEF